MLQAETHQTKMTMKKTWSQKHQWGFAFRAQRHIVLLRRPMPLASVPSPLPPQPLPEQLCELYHQTPTSHLSRLLLARLKPLLWIFSRIEFGQSREQGALKRMWLPSAGYASAPHLIPRMQTLTAIDHFHLPLRMHCSDKFLNFCANWTLRLRGALSQKLPFQHLLLKHLPRRPSPMLLKQGFEHWPGKRSARYDGVQRRQPAHQTSSFDKPCQVWKYFRGTLTARILSAHFLFLSPSCLPSVLESLVMALDTSLALDKELPFRKPRQVFQVVVVLGTSLALDKELPFRTAHKVFRVAELGTVALPMTLLELDTSGTAAPALDRLGKTPDLALLL